MARYLCIICGYIYDEKIGDIDSGIKPNTLWKDIPEKWYCPVCGVSKSDKDSWEKLEDGKK